MTSTFINLIGNSLAIVIKQSQRGFTKLSNWFHNYLLCRSITLVFTPIVGERRKGGANVDLGSQEWENSTFKFYVNPK